MPSSTPLIAFCLLLSIASLFPACVLPHPAIPGHLNYTVDSKDCRVTVERKDCDSNVPARCAHTFVTYPQGCEKLAAGQVTK